MRTTIYIIGMEILLGIMSACVSDNLWVDLGVFLIINVPLVLMYIIYRSEKIKEYTPDDYYNRDKPFEYK